MHHLIQLVTNPWVIASFLVLLNYHHLPKKIWIPFGIFFKGLWYPVYELDKYLFEIHEEVKEIKKSKFKKIVSPFGKFFLFVIAFLIYFGDKLFIQPATKLVDKILKSKYFQGVIKWIEKRDIIILRIFVGIPFFLMEITGIIAGFMILSNPILGIVIYLSKFAWVIPFKFIDKVGHDKLSNDPWYSGLKGVAVKAINAVTNLNAIKSIKNKIVSVKNFINDSKHNTKVELKIRKKILAKVFKEIWSLNHLSDELSEDSDIEIIFFGPQAVKKLELLKDNPDNQLLREDVMDDFLSEIK